MTWHSKHPSDRGEPAIADPLKAKLYDELKISSLPVIDKDQGKKPLDPIAFQPVISPSIYEAEFGVKDGDIIFHFWPYGYHAAERSEKRPPGFTLDFLPTVKKVLAEFFTPNRIKVTEDSDVGAITVQALGWGENNYARELAIKACRDLHFKMGGKDDS